MFVVCLSAQPRPVLPAAQFGQQFSVILQLERYFLVADKYLHYIE